MSTIAVRPATADDFEAARSVFPNIQPDRWREGGNRRSFVAVRQPETGGPDGAQQDQIEVLGHCRGIDNEFHPDSRTLVFEVLPELHGSDAEKALFGEQVEASTLPLHTKPERKDEALRALLFAFGSVLVQLMPPWRYTVGPELRAWAESTLAEIPPDVRIVPATSIPVAQLRDLEAEHYIAQHESWSPPGSRETLLEQFAEDHDPASASSWDREHSRAVVTDDGELVAAALVWGRLGTAEAPATGDAAPEVGHLSRPYASQDAWARKLRALAAVIASVPDGAELCIDSHLSMREEYEAIGTIPGPDRESGEWMAIVATPVPGGPAPIPLDPALVPDAADWARAFTVPRPARGASYPGPHDD